MPTARRGSNPACIYAESSRSPTRRDLRPNERSAREASTALESAAVVAQLIADTDGQENLVSYRWHAALYPVLAPLDDEINIGTGLRFTFRIFTLANAVGPNRQRFRDPMEGEVPGQ